MLSNHIRHSPAPASSHSIGTLKSLFEGGRSSSRWLYLLERISEMGLNEGIWLYSNFKPFAEFSLSCIWIEALSSLAGDFLGDRDGFSWWHVS